VPLARGIRRVDQSWTNPLKPGYENVVT